MSKRNAFQHHLTSGGEGEEIRKVAILGSICKGVMRMKYETDQRGIICGGRQTMDRKFYIVRWEKPVIKTKRRGGTVQRRSVPNRGRTKGKIRPVKEERTTNS